MDHSTQQNQEIHLSNSLESMVVCQKTQQERKPRPQQEPALKCPCPRCDSINTKFCYYNNYSLTQPRYFCKSCRRYWTKGGTLRNIPVGGACRKNKKSSASSPSSSSFKRSLNDQPFALDPATASYYDSSDFSYSFGQPHCRENFNLVSGFENHCSSDTLKNRFIESYLSSRQKLQSGYENAEMGKADNGGLKSLYDHNEVGKLTTTAVIKTTTKEEVFGGQETERKIVWEFPWQNKGDGTGVESYPGRDYQSRNGASSSWPHGLIYSPLM